MAREGTANEANGIFGLEGEEVSFDDGRVNFRSQAQKRGQEAQKRGQEPIVRSTLRAIWLLVPDPFSEPRNQ